MKPGTALFLKLQGRELRARLAPALRQESARWLFVLRATLAAFLALWLSMFLQLDKPFLAMASVAIVMQPQSGTVLAKSVYRIIGNFAGGGMAVLLFSLFEQQPAWILSGLGLWVLFCTVGAAKQRDAQSYGFVLAGYTACIIALPDLSMPGQVLVTAALRISEIMIGILCACLISEILFPETVAEALYNGARKRFDMFDDFARNVLTGRIGQEEVEDTQLRFINDVAVLESYGAAASFEAAAGAHKSQVRLFNSVFMSVSTSLHSLYAFTQDILPSAGGFVQKLVGDTLGQVADILAGKGGQDDHAPLAVRAKAEAAAACRENVSQALLREASSAHLTRTDAGILKAAEHFLGRFLADMHSYLMRYADLSKPDAKVAVRPVRFTAHIGKSIPIMSGLRAAVLLLILSLCWWLFAWPDANGSTMTSIAVTFCALRAADADPARSIFRVCLGAGVGVVVSNFYSFLILPNMTGFAPLLSSYFPFLGIGLYCTTIPRIAGPARMYCIILVSFSGLTPAFSVNPADLVSRSVAEIMGIASAGVLHMLFFPVGGLWWRNGLRKALLREASEACSFSLDSVEHYFESGIRDILLQFTASATTSQEDKKEMLKQTLAVSSLGRIIIELREYLAGKDCPEVYRRLCAPVLSRLGLFFKKPSWARLEAVERQMRHALEESAAAKEARGPAAARASEVSMLLHILYKELTLATDDLGLRATKNAAAADGVEHAS